MSDTQSLLIELGCEELPPGALDALSAAFAQGICEGLRTSGIKAATAAARVWNSPRRLAVHIPAVGLQQPQQSIERRGPAVQAALDAEGKPGKALLGFARSCGVEVEALEQLETDKGAWFVYRDNKPGQSTAELLPQILTDTLKHLPIPRPMHWSDHDYSFVRPVHWLVMLHGAEVIDAQLLGLVSGRHSHGHRFHHPKPVHVANADSWLDALRSAFVLADPAERRERIRQQVARAATSGTPQLSADLLDEIANLTEWPTAIACSFDRDFLGVPAEALVTTMETNQKFVPVFDAGGALAEHFIGVANIESSHPAEIRKGYERVIRPRFADARFFYDEDLKTPLAGYQQQLRKVTFQQALGSVWDKSLRVAELSRIIANRVGVDAAVASHAASLAKCDLMTRMVGEFPELQGVMGRYYAQAHDEQAEVVQALDEYYMPRHSGDRIAEGAVSRVLAVAERIDTLCGIFAVGLKPTGNKDPFALRRAALGLGRTLIEASLEIDLKGILAEALELLPETALEAGHRAEQQSSKADTPFDTGLRRKQLVAELYTFVIERLRGYYADLGFANAQFEAVSAVAPATLSDFDRRLRAVAAFARLPASASLAAANKRVGNILAKQADAGQHQSMDIRPGLFEGDAERGLAEALQRAGANSDRMAAAADYTGALETLAGLQQPVDRFFDEVLVMADDLQVRNNRLALLAALKARFLAIADISLLQD